MSASEPIDTPTLPTSPSRLGRVGVEAELRGQVERDREPGLALAEQVLEALVGLPGVPNPAYCRMVQSLPRYMFGWMPRVNGYSPGGGGACFTSPGP